MRVLLSEYIITWLCDLARATLEVAHIRTNAPLRKLRRIVDAEFFPELSLCEEELRHIMKVPLNHWTSREIQHFRIEVHT